MARIIWAEYFNNRPVSGIAEVNGESVYFKERGVLGFVSSFEEVELPPVVREEVAATYVLHRITPEQSEILTNEHNRICETTGAPKLHGDPHVFYVNTVQPKCDPATVKTNSDGSIDATLNSVVGTRVTYQIAVDQFRGHYLGVVPPEYFDNFAVPYICEFR